MAKRCSSPNDCQRTVRPINPMATAPAQPIKRARTRSPKVNDRLPSGSCNTLMVSEQPDHLVAALAFTDAAVVLNPKARRLRNDLVSGGKADAVSDLSGFVASSNQDPAVHDREDAE